MTKTDHLAKARDYIAIAESGDAKITAYMGAAVEIRDSGASYREAGAFLKRSPTGWVAGLMRWAEQFEWGVRDPLHPPFGGAEQNEGRYQRADRRKVEDAIAERPEAVAKAIAKASPEAQRKIADELIKGPKVDPLLKHIADPPPRAPREPKPAEQRLGEATFALWEIGELLLDEVPTAEERLRMLAIAEKAEKLAAGIVYLLDTGELEDEFRRLVEEVGADA